MNKISCWRWLRCLALTLFPACSANVNRDAAEDRRADASDLVVLQQATRAFRSLDSAVVAGYARDVKNCLVHEHHGAMGYHHVNAGYMDREIDVRKPEILLYERLGTGQYRLNGVEFIVPYRAWPRDSIPPRVMGQPMRREENLRFWYLHVWAWTTNPDGLFADFHPEIQCPPDARQVFMPSGGQVRD